MVEPARLVAEENLGLVEAHVTIYRPDLLKILNRLALLFPNYTDANMSESPK